MNNAKPSAELLKLVGQDKAEEMVAEQPKPGMFAISAEDGMVTLRMPYVGDFAGFDAQMAREIGVAFITCAAKLEFAQDMALKSQAADIGPDLLKIIGKKAPLNGEQPAQEPGEATTH